MLEKVLGIGTGKGSGWNSLFHWTESRKRSLITKWRMKSGKDGENSKMDPLFPRLHITDAEKFGGPRAPPRNKMALCEQLSLSTQRFNPGTGPGPGSVSLFSLPPKNATSLLPSSSSSSSFNHVTRYKRSVFSLYGSSPGSSRLAEKLDHYSSGEMDMKTMLRSVREPMETTHCETLCGSGEQLKASSSYRLKPQSFMNLSTTSIKKLVHDENYIVPTLSLVGNSPNSASRQKITPLMTRSHENLPTPCKARLMQVEPIDLTPKLQLWDSSEENKPVAEISKDHAKEPTPVLSSSLCISQPGLDDLAHLQLNKRIKLLDQSSTLHDPNLMSQQKQIVLQENLACVDGFWVEPENATRKTSGSENPENRQSSCGFDAMAGKCEELDYGYPHLRDVENMESFSDTDSVPEIFPDEVVGLIGRKHFLDARRTIANQQRAFAKQIFELHRLIKVQRLIAKSPHFFLEAGFCTGRPSTEASAFKKIYSEDISGSTPRVNSPRRDAPACFPAEMTIRKSPPLSDDTETMSTHQSNHMGNSVMLPLPPSTTSDPKLGLPYFHPPPGNQWLIPVRLPSEGLVYKPYTPPTGLMAPVYGTQGLMSLTPPNENLPDAAYGFTASYFPTSAIDLTYFPTYGWSMIKSPSISSGLDRLNPFSRANNDFNLLPYKPSCTVSGREKLAILTDIQHMEEHRERELPGGSGNSPLGRKQGGDELPLFPTAPTAIKDSDNTASAQSNGSDERIKVIKVVPHNPTLALESAARIFHSIQQERKRKD